MTASNTKDCFREFVGLRMTGLLFDALPVSDKGLAAGTKTMIFEDGRGLTIAANGSYWIENAEEVQRAIRVRQRELVNTERELAEVIAAAGTF